MRIQNRKGTESGLGITQKHVPSVWCETAVGFVQFSHEMMQQPVQRMQEPGPKIVSHFFACRGLGKNGADRLSPFSAMLMCAHDLVMCVHDLVMCTHDVRQCVPTIW